MISKFKKICTRENLAKVLMVFLILQPLLDTYILFEKSTVDAIGISPSTIVRLLFVFIIGLISIFVIKSRRQWIGYIIYILLVILYSIFHFYNATSFNSLTPGNFNYSLSAEAFYIIRMLIPLFIVVISSNIKFSTGCLNRIVNILCIMISGTIVVTNIFKISIGAYITKFVSYNIIDWFISNVHASHTFYDTATRGYFSFANTISSLLFGLTAMLYYQLFKKYDFKLVILIVLQMLAMFMLGTKVATYGFVLISIVMLFIYIYFAFVKKEVKFSSKPVVFIFILFASWALIYPYSPCRNRVNGVSVIEEREEKNNAKKNDLMLKNSEIAMLDMTEEEKGEYVKGFVRDNYVSFAIKKQYILKKYPYQYDAYFWYTIFPLPYRQKTDNRFLVSSIYDRLKLLNGDKVSDDLFGLSYSRTSTIGTLERDFSYQYYSLGVFGSILLISPYLLIIVFAIIYIIFNRKDSIFKLKNVSLIAFLCASLAGAYFCGNTLDNLTFSIIFAFFLGQLVRNLFVFSEKNEVEDDEITILALHLGVGGVEKYISSLCKMLENDYKINIISTYKLDERPAFSFSEKVNISYLINDKPYRKELKDSFKAKNIFKIIKYGFKNLRLYVLRYVRNVNAVRNIKSKYVITTRTFHNSIVNNELDRNYVKIATEHNYHNNDKKYVNDLVASVRNFDYLVCVSKELKEYYEKKIDNAKVIYIPNTVDYIGDFRKGKPSKKLISVGRFSKEKGFVDLIDVMSYVVNLDSEIKLTLIGDGDDRKLIEDRINELGLKNNIKLTGYMKSEKELSEYYDDSDLYVMTSFTESFGIVLIEAMSHSLPCIAFDSANGACNLLKDSVGVLISDRNKEEMAKRIVEILNNDKIYKEYSKKAYDFSENYDIMEVKKSWINLLEGSILKSSFDNLYTDTKLRFFDEIKNNLKNNMKQFIVTANSEIYVYGKDDSLIKEMLLDNNVTVVPDGISVVKGAKKLGYNVKERIPGVEISEKLMEYGNKYKKSIYLFGAKQEILNLLSSKIKDLYPNLKIVGLQHGYEKDRDKVFKDIISKKPDIVLVALGVPEQEKLIYKYYNEFDKGIFVGVGGSFDVLSGSKKRAPKVFIKTNTEWLYRILKEPKRIKRFWNNNVKFLLNIRKYK